MSEKRSFDISAYTKEQVEKIFAQIEFETSELEDHIEIEKIITKSLGGRLLLNMVFYPNEAPVTLYRVTPASKSSWFKVNKKSTYSYPPSPKIGRANIPEKPVFYASLDPTTAIREMKNRLNPGKDFYISEWKFNPKKTTYGHCLVLNSTTEKNEDQFLFKMANHHADQVGTIFQNVPKEINDGMIHATRKMGDLFTIPGEEKYKITSAYAYHILYGIRAQRAYLPILLYPSVANNHQSINFAIHPELIKNESVELQRVFKLSIPNESDWTLDDLDKVQVLERGIHQQGAIEWQALRVSWEMGNPENVFVKTVEGDLHRGEKVLGYKLKSWNKTIKEIIWNELHSDNLRTRLEVLADKHVIKDIFNYEGYPLEEIFILDLPENEIATTESDPITISSIVMPVAWSKSYMKKA
jgi:hypothetical protein